MILTTNIYSDEDDQPGQANQLGRTLDVYRVKPSLIRLGRKVCWSLISFSIVCLIPGVGGLVMALVAIVQAGGSLPTSEYDIFPLIICLLLIGSVNLFLGCIMLQQIQTQRLVICEHGLLKITRKIKSNRVETMRWQDVLEVRRAYIGERFDYALVSYEGKILSLADDYPNIEEIIAQIKQCSEEAKSKALEANQTEITE